MIFGWDSEFEEKNMHFEVVSTISDCKNSNTIYLLLDGWDDWFTYSTLFNVKYIDQNGNRHSLAGVKIGQKGQARSPKLPSKFYTLSEEYFSLGSNENYYIALKEEFPDDKIRFGIFEALNDVAYNLELFDRVNKLDVMQTSLMRDFTASIVKNQFHRMTLGGAWLTPFNFSYYPDAEIDVFDEDGIELEFKVEPEKKPPSNIHILIGKNGVGKTTLLKNMINSLEDNEYDYGKFRTWGGNGFANIVYVSFSAFDKFLDIEDDLIPYFYIGLAKKDGMKNLDELATDFASSLFEISQGNRKKLWEEVIAILESDNTFIDLEIKRWFEKEIYFEINKNIRKNGDGVVTKNIGAKNKERLKEVFVKKTVPKFEKLSSGHKVILLIVARLIELVEEKTLVIMDEPEEHLHPPLVSALIRALSDLLIYRNGVGIIATHSPVIVQEVPKECVWILRRTGEELVAERPEIETFGENLGVLTSEIFGYEVTNSGFHSMIQNFVEKYPNYKRALRAFDGQLGDEGKMILRSLMYEKQQLEEEIDD